MRENKSKSGNLAEEMQLMVTEGGKNGDGQKGRKRCWERMMEESE